MRNSSIRCTPFNPKTGNIQVQEIYIYIGRHTAYNGFCNVFVAEYKGSLRDVPVNAYIHLGQCQCLYICVYIYGKVFPPFPDITCTYIHFCIITKQIFGFCLNTLKVLNFESLKCISLEDVCCKSKKKVQFFYYEQLLLYLFIILKQLCTYFANLVN